MAGVSLGIIGDMHVTIRGSRYYTFWPRPQHKKSATAVQSSNESGDELKEAQGKRLQSSSVHTLKK